MARNETDTVLFQRLNDNLRLESLSQVASLSDLGPAPQWNGSNSARYRKFWSKVWERVDAADRASAPATGSASVT